MNLPSTNMHLEIAKLVNGYLVRYTVDRGAGSPALTSDPVMLADKAALKAYLAVLADDVK